MQERVPITKVVEAYQAYEQLALRLGFQVKKGVVRKHALKSTDYRGAMKSFFSTTYAKRHANHTAPAGIFDAIDKLNHDLAGVIRKKINGALPKGTNGDIVKLAQNLKRVPPAKLAVAAEAVAQSDQSQFLKRAEIDIKEFQALLKRYAKGQTIARGKLVRHLQTELKKRGEEMSLDAIEERFRANTKVRTVPACFADILRDLDVHFLTGLVPIEEMVGGAQPEAWLEDCRGKLGFRSHNAMHKALAEATSLNYEAIHKALTRPRPGRRIQSQIRDTLHGWLEAAGQGKELSVPDRYLGVAAEEVRKVLDELARFYPKRSRLYRDAATAMGVRSALLRRTHKAPEDRKTYPAEALRKLKEFAKTRKSAAGPASYLAKGGTRKLAARLSYRANEALRKWQQDRENSALRGAYRSLRLQLIIAMKQRRTESDWIPIEAADDDDDADELEL